MGKKKSSASRKHQSLATAVEEAEVQVDELKLGAPDDTAVKTEASRRKNKNRAEQNSKIEEKKEEEFVFDYTGGENLEEDDDVTQEEDVKQLSRKELKKLKKQGKYLKEAKEIEESQFSVSQREPAGKGNIENSADIKIEKFGISARGKELFVNANLQISAGRRYGLVGPNGSAK